MLTAHAEPQGFGKRLRKDSHFQNRKLLPWLFIGPFLWVHVVQPGNVSGHHVATVGNQPVTGTCGK
jgi:hypothetical protein